MLIPIGTGDVARQLGVPTASANHALKSLLKKGYVKEHVVTYSRLEWTLTRAGIDARRTLLCEDEKKSQHAAHSSPLPESKDAGKGGPDPGAK
jgi:DNA-binding MarR family transcriptional regulator